uniref:NADH dehydrogenase [ubiquinone] 1 beta subcomplex subunit 6 n=1 Tax=Salvator merianae TaxID=96440 RepID=A0A8D0E5N4_SALMN
MSKGSGVEHPRGPPGEVVGYTPDEKLRLQQLRELRRRWLKDQELSPREPVLPPRKLGPIEGFWERFLQPGGFWRQQVFRTYKTGKFIILGGIIPLWLSHYIIKYHLMTMPYAVVSSKPKIYPGDVIQETGEVIPPLEIPSSHH